MKSYPSIEYWNHGIIGDKVWAFDKLDGSNMRFEWGRKRKENNGWYKFGTKNVMIDEKNEQFGEAITIFMEKYSEPLNRVFRDNKDYRNILSFVVFGEYVGENSFAGRHEPSDKKDVVLFDVNAYKKGFITPREFLDDFGHLHIPKLVYEGNLNKELVEAVRRNDFGLTEGLIAKGFRKVKSQNIVWMVKMKTNDWFDRLRNRYGEKAVQEELKGEMEILT